MTTDIFQSYDHAEFSEFAGILSAALSQYHVLGFEIAQLEVYAFIISRDDAKRFTIISNLNCTYIT